MVWSARKTALEMGEAFLETVVAVHRNQNKMSRNCRRAVTMK